MKKSLLFLPVVLMTILMSSCSSDDDVVDRLTKITDIPANADLSIDYLPINLFEIPIEQNLNLRQLIDDELGSDEALDQVKEVELEDMSIELLSADDQENFDFIESVTLGVRTDELPYKEVATLENIPSGVSILDLKTTDDLYVDDYAKSENMKLVIKFKSVEDAYNLDLKLRMEFDAKLDPSL